jgi:nucleoside 2-deoxyribosyltransferase
MKTIYLIGSLRNPTIIEIANKLRKLGFDVFDDWMAAGPEADDYWRDYEKARGHNYAEALKGHAAFHVYNFDREHLEKADAGILALPAGKSGHLELGWLLGKGKPGYILLEGEPERYDVMYLFASGVFNTFEELANELKKLT